MTLILAYVQVNPWLDEVNTHVASTRRSQSVEPRIDVSILGAVSPLALQDVTGSKSDVIHGGSRAECTDEGYRIGSTSKRVKVGVD